MVILIPLWMVLVAAAAAGGGITKVLGNRRKHTLRVAKYAHRVLNQEADGDPRAAMRVLAERIKERRMEIDGAPRNKQREVAKMRNDDMKLMQAAIEVLKKINR